MTKYVALIRGITPTNPNMSNEKLRGVLEGLGLSNVRSVISSGNILFESLEKNSAKLERMIEKAFNKQLGITGITIVRSREELQELVDHNPFKDSPHNSKTYLTVTFFRSNPHLEFDLPYRPNGKAYEIIATYDHVLCSVVDLTAAKTPDMMAWLERRFGKEITTRTWKTVERILAKLDQ
jgi:uncharacterized protein (DUF1697 family)